MSSPVIYTPVAYPLGSFEIPSDGDEITASSVGVPIKAIADGLKYERDRRAWEYELSLSDQPIVLGTITASNYTDVVQIVSTDKALVGDTLRALYTGHVACNGSMSMRLAIGPTRIPMWNAFAYRCATTADIVPITMQGIMGVTALMLNSGALEIYLQAKIAAPASLVVWTPHALTLEFERS